MLDSLDTLIAFVLIMLVVSLLITIVVQMCAAVLNLRGLNLAQGLKRTFTVIDPKKSDQDAKKLANFILKARFFSDSFLPDWGIFKGWRHATAIRPKEIFDAIQRIASGNEPVDEQLWKKQQRSTSGNASLAGQATGNESPAANLKQTARRLLIHLGVTEEIIDAAKTAEQTAQSLIAAASEGLKSLSQADQDKVRGVLNVVGDRLVAAERAVATQVKAVVATIDAARHRFENWAGTCEERAQQWFTMHTRIITAIFAFVFAFWLQLDTVEIFKLVSSNKNVRDKLVAQASVVEAQAARILVDSNVLQNALKSWSDKESDPDIKKALVDVEVKETDGRDVVKKKVAKAFGADALKDKTPIYSFDSMVATAAKKRADELSGELSAVKADLEKGTFQLFPDSTCGRWGTGTWWCGSQGHRWGILFSVALLSLGAPFWYNILKNLVNLRSQVAQNISAQKEQAQKQPGGTEPEPPPTVRP